MKDKKPREPHTAKKAQDAGDAEAAAAASDAGDHEAVTSASDSGETETVTQVVVVERKSRLRTILVGLLVVLTCLSVVVTGVSWWVHYTVFNTTGYMNVVGPVGKDPKAIRALSDYVAGQVVSATDLQARTETALPPKAKFLAAPVTAAVDSFIADGANKLLSTPQAYALWLKVNTVAHDQVVALLRGKTTYTYIQGNDVKLDTLPLVSQVLVWIDGKLPGVLGTKFNPPVIAPGTPPSQSIPQVSTWLGRPLPPDFGQITLLQNNALGPAQTAVKWFDTLVWVVLVVTLLLAAASILLSRRRLRTLIELGIGTAVALILTQVIVKQGSQALVNNITTESGASMARDLVSASIHPLTTLTLWIAGIGIVVAVIAWIAGRRDVREVIVKTTKRAVGAEREATAIESPFAVWVERSATWLRLAGLAAGLILLLAATSSWAAFVLWIVLVVVYEGAISLIARQWPFHRGGREGPATV